MGDQRFLFGQFQLEFFAEKCSESLFDLFCLFFGATDYVSSKVNPFDPLFDAPFRAFSMAVRETQRHSGPRFCEPGARAMPPLTWVGERYAPRATGVLH